jgi:nucleotide-binding universal stress UspA family protein
VPVLDTILVAYDDPTSETLARAADLASALGSKLIVTNVAAPADSATREEAERDARERLAAARRYLDGRGMEAELVASVGPPAEAIVELARSRNANLIVVGTRKKRFFERLVEGSVNQDVLRHARCDVLVVY